MYVAWWLVAWTLYKIFANIKHLETLINMAWWLLAWTSYKIFKHIKTFKTLINVASWLVASTFNKKLERQMPNFSIYV